MKKITKKYHPDEIWYLKRFGYRIPDPEKIRETDSEHISEGTSILGKIFRSLDEEFPDPPDGHS